MKEHIRRSLLAEHILDPLLFENLGLLELPGGKHHVHQPNDKRDFAPASVVSWAPNNVDSGADQHEWNCCM